MRVISGSARGRKLIAPEGSATRPTPDRVREATFNALGSLGVVQDAAVLDLFAGSGAMGIEALSRGAARATFVDHDIAARRAIEANLATCGLGGRAEVVAHTAERFVAGAGQPRRWDLALLDPPYDYDGWPELLLDLPATSRCWRVRGRWSRRSGGRWCGRSGTGAPTWSSLQRSRCDASDQRSLV